VPTVYLWAHGGAHVELEGSFDGWSARHALQRSGRDFSLVKLLAPGVYQYKFIVDGAWRHDPNLPSMYDDAGNVNNVVEVQEYVPENLASLSGFEPPPSPPSSYASPPPAAEDFLKEPPALPPQLQLSLLNVPPPPDAGGCLPRPQHVVLNHIYQQRAARGAAGAAVVGTTHRFRSKYVTVQFVTPRARRGGAGAPPRGAPAPAASDAGGSQAMEG
jgi:5'-AMP-activated protein kinase regulatory beta subunit